MRLEAEQIRVSRRSALNVRWQFSGFPGTMRGDDDVRPQFLGIVGRPVSDLADEAPVALVRTETRCHPWLVNTSTRARRACQQHRVEVLSAQRPAPCMARVHWS